LIKRNGTPHSTATAAKRNHPRLPTQASSPRAAAVPLTAPNGEPGPGGQQGDVYDSSVAGSGPQRQLFGHVRNHAWGFSVEVPRALVSRRPERRSG
jgi:hypothetical protein